MLGRIRDFASVHGPDYFAYWKYKNSRHNINHVCVYCCLFFLLSNMFAMWLTKLLLLLHDSCNIWFYAWCCNTESTVQIFSQLPDNAYASNSKCLLKCIDRAALMQANVKSTPDKAQGPHPPDIFGGKGQIDCNLLHVTNKHVFEK